MTRRLLTGSCERPLRAFFALFGGGDGEGEGEGEGESSSDTTIDAVPTLERERDGLAARALFRLVLVDERVRGAGVGVTAFGGGAGVDFRGAGFRVGGGAGVDFREAGFGVGRGAGVDLRGAGVGVMALGRGAAADVEGAEGEGGACSRGGRRRRGTGVPRPA
jgi:hypothetical protein